MFLYSKTLLFMSTVLVKSPSRDLRLTVSLLRLEIDLSTFSCHARVQPSLHSHAACCHVRLLWLLVLIPQEICQSMSRLHGFHFRGFVAVLGAGTVFFKDLLSPTAIISILGVAFGFTTVLNGLLSYVGYETSDENAHKFVGASVFFFVLSCLMVLYHVIRRWLAIRGERKREREAQAKKLRSAAVEDLFSDAGKV